MELPPSRRPAGPEDPGPKPLISMTSHQARELRAVTAEHPHSIGVRDEGDAWVAVLLYDPEGRVVDERLLPPV